MSDDPDLRALVDAFEAGNYRGVRDAASRIEKDPEKSEAVKSAARDLRARTEPSRAQIALLIIAALLVLALSAFEIVTHGRDAPKPQPRRPAIERVH